MNKKQTTRAINCYSDGEGAMMTWSRDIREKLLRPVLILLGDAGVRPGHVTLLSLLFGLAFCPLFIAQEYFWAFGSLLMHVLLDGVDGPLARYLNRAGDRGSFTDTAADQVVVTATTVTMIYTGLAGAHAGGWYIFLYTAVVVFAMIRNALNTPYSWLFRPRFLVFAWIFVELTWLPGSLNIVLWASCALLAFKSLSGFIAIRRKI